MQGRKVHPDRFGTRRLAFLIFLLLCVVRQITVAHLLFVYLGGSAELCTEQLVKERIFGKSALVADGLTAFVRGDEQISCIFYSHKIDIFIRRYSVCQLEHVDKIIFAVGEAVAYLLHRKGVHIFLDYDLVYSFSQHALWGLVFLLAGIENGQQLVKNKSFFKTCPKGVLAYLFHLMKKRQHQSYVKLALERKPVGGVFNITSEMDVKVFGTVAGFIGGLLQVCFLNIIVIFANCDPFPILNKLQRAVKHKYYDILGPDPCYMLLSRLKITKITQKVFGKIVKTESFHNNTPFIIL